MSQTSSTPKRPAWSWSWDVMGAEKSESCNQSSRRTRAGKFVFESLELLALSAPGKYGPMAASLRSVAARAAPKPVKRPAAVRRPQPAAQRRRGDQTPARFEYLELWSLSSTHQLPFATRQMPFQRDHGTILLEPVFLGHDWFIALVPAATMLAVHARRR